MAIKKIVIYIVCLVFGFSLTFLVLKLTFKNAPVSLPFVKNRAVSIGFMPYWLIDKADKDYRPYLTEMTYFSLTVKADGSIKQYDRPGEAEPGWYALTSGKFTPPQGMPTSLTLFSGDPDTINELVGDPASHAATLAGQVGPILSQYGFTKVNLDLEDVLPASDSARANFAAFVSEFKSRLNKPLTIDVSPTDLIQPRLIDLAQVAPLVDQVILMTYDYHFAGSFVTGPVAPNTGAGVESEFDTETGIQKALEIMPPEKIILGVPLYGYEWETLTPNPRSAVLPGSGIIASSRRMEDFLAACSSCSAQIEGPAQESYLTYLDQETDTYHQIFYPDQTQMQTKIDLANKYHLAGLAFWALGYEGKTILNPLTLYLK